MEEITPELIARMASRLYNDAPNQAATSQATSYATTGHASSMGSNPAAIAVPGVNSIPGPSIPSPSPSIPRPSSANLALPTGTTPLGFPQSPSTFPQVPSSFPQTPSGLPQTPIMFPQSASLAPHADRGVGREPASTESGDGLKRFVQQLRHNFGTPPNSHFDQLKHAQSIESPKGIASSASRPFDVAAIREDFPILRQKVHGKPLAWFDNAATTQKPQSVIDAISRFYEQDNSNIHRGAHTLAARATDAYEQARQKVTSFLGAGSPSEIVFVRGTTEGINLVAQTYARKFLQQGDEIVLSVLEHHANIVPWQMIAKEKGAVLRVIPVNDRGEIMLSDYQQMLGPRTKIVALTQANNSLGTILPVHEMTQMAKRYGARVLIDGAQSVAHIPVNVQQLGCDFFVFSGHKIFGPTGIGAVYIKQELHEILPPWQGGGNMIRNVTFEETTYSEAPAKFEAGTPNIADAVGLGAALDYVNRLGLPNIAQYEHGLLEYATEKISRIPGLRLLGAAREKVALLSFVLDNKRTEDVGRMLDQEGIAVRSGHHCAQPSLRRFGVESSVRPSFSLYNTRGEIDRMIDALKRIQRMP